MSIKITKINGVEYGRSGQAGQQNQQPEPGPQQENRPGRIHLTLTPSGQSGQAGNAGSGAESAQAAAYARQIEELQAVIAQKNQMIESQRRIIEDSGMSGEDLQSLDAQLTQMRRQVADKGEELSSLSRESARLDTEMENLQQGITEKEQEARRLQDRNEELQKETLGLKDLKDDELLDAVDSARARWQALVAKADHAGDDLKMDGDQLGEMRRTEFIDPVQLRALENEYDDLHRQMAEFQNKIRQLCVDARKKSEKRTNDLYTES